MYLFVAVVTCRLSNKPQIEQHSSFKKWHKAYHGTPFQNVEKILDTGGILPAGKQPTSTNFHSSRPT